MHVLTNPPLLFNSRIVANLSQFNLGVLFQYYFKFDGETAYLWYKMK